MNDQEKKSYRAYFGTTERAIEYDTQQFNSQGYGDVLWRVEQTQLQALLDEFRQSHANVSYMDFASGTGRIISFMEGLVDSATGIEISESMAELARSKLKVGTIVCRDITNPEAPLEGAYDLITAFRFILNAEPSLRLHALKALANRLRDDTSWLIFNNHNYLWSHKLIAFPIDATRGIGRGYQTSGNYLTHRQVVRLAEAAGLTIERTIGCGVLSGKITRRMAFEKAVNLERKAAESSFWAKFGVNQMYVARRAKK